MVPRRPAKSKRSVQNQPLLTILFSIPVFCIIDFTHPVAVPSNRRLELSRRFSGVMVGPLGWLFALISFFCTFPLSMVDGLWGRAVWLRKRDMDSWLQRKFSTVCGMDGAGGRWPIDTLC